MACLTMCYPSAFAVGFGEVSLRSNLGEVLRVQVPLTGATEDTLVANCIQPKIETLNGELIDKPNVDFVLPTKPNQPVYLNVVSHKVMVEPAVKFSIAMTCGGLVSREYALLLDFADSAMSTAPATAPVAQPATVLTPLPAESVKPAPVVKRPRTSHAAAESSNAKKESEPLPPVGSSVKRSKQKLKAGKDVLHVTSEENLPDTELKLSQDLTESNSVANSQDQQRLAENKLAAAQFAAILRGEDPLVTAQNEIKKEQQKISGLENEIKKIDALNAQRELEDKKFSPLLIGLIATLTALFLALIALVFVAVRRSKSKEKTWWDPSAEQKKNVVDIVDYLQTTAESGNLDPNPIPPGRDNGANDNNAVKEVAQPQPQPLNKEEPAPKFKRMGLPALEDTNSSTFNFFGNRGQSIHIEEISDITQEAEFWMSVNDPHRAIEILEPASRDENPTTPVTWLYLLDLYRLVGDEDNYRDLRHRFKLKFNAKIPNFHEEIVPGSVRSFDDFPHLISNCCALWHTDDIVPYLESLLVDNREGERVGFDLPVYQDILFLLAICNELKRGKYNAPQKELDKEPPLEIAAKLPDLDDAAEEIHAASEVHDLGNSLNFDVLEFKTDDKK